MSSISNHASHAALAVLFALGGSALAEGCCFGAPVAAPAPTSVTVPAVVPATPTPAAGGTCGRATECCTAYCDAITNAQGNIAAQAMAGSIGQVRSVCGTYASMAANPGTEPGCQSAIDGYRSGLTAMSLEVPAACQ